MTYKKLIKFLREQTGPEKKKPLQNLENLHFVQDQPINPSIRALRILDLRVSQKTIWEER